MRHGRFSQSAFLIAVVLSTPVIATAAQAGHRARGAASAQGQAVPRAGAGRSDSQPGPSPEARRAQPPPATAPAPSAPSTQPQARRGEFPRASVTPRALPRAVAPPQDVRPLYRPDYRPNYQPGYRPSYQPDYRPYYRPYYSFLPRVHLRFGLWAGYPVTYPVYLYPAYLYPAPYPGPSYPTSVYPVPGAASIGAVGALSFDINPSDARIYVDLQYVGVAGQFSPTQPPLSLAPGRHHVEIHASGFEVIAFDVDIAPGEVIPYQGDLQRF
jgi:hypothetical protein